MKGKNAKWCMKCFFHGMFGGEICCDFVLVMKKPRGCPAGLECTQFISKNGKARRDQILIGTPKPKEEEKSCKECPHRMTKFRRGHVISYCPLFDEEVDPNKPMCRIIV